MRIQLLFFGGKNSAFNLKIERKNNDSEKKN
jgi:hypothetical protein